jgi:outer membrane protein OmpA-like peptidoglycan-associated protein
MSIPAILPPSTLRRSGRRLPRWRIALLMLALLSLAACKSAAPKPPSLAQRQVQLLQSLGFNKTEDGWLLSLPDPISFEFDQARLKADVQRNVDRFAEQLLKLEIGSLRVEGHSDNIGPRQVNVELSQRRAEAVAREFIARGFASSSIQSIGLGPDSPAAPNDTRDGRAQNRRVEIIVPADALVLTQ